MILDSTLEFCDATDVSATAGTAIAGDVIDLDAAGQDGVEGMYLVIQVTTDFATATTAEVSFQLASDAAAAIATDGSASIHVQTAAYDTGVLTAGRVFVIEIPRGSLPTYERYLGLLAVTTSATTTAGSINAFLTLDASTWKSYPDAVN